MNELFGSEDWKSIGKITDSAQRNLAWIGLYTKQLKAIGGASFVRSFEMKNDKNQTIYHLVFGTKHWRGLEVMKEAMWHIDSAGNYRFSDITNPAQSTFLDFSNEAWWMEQAAGLIYSKYRGKKAYLDMIHQYTIIETPFLFRKAILKSLESRSPSKILNVIKRDKKSRRAYTYPDGCLIEFADD